MHYRATTGIGFPRQAAGLSIVELMIALTLLALVSIAGLQVLQFSQSSFSEGRAVLSAQQKNQAIAAYINQDFRNGKLPENNQPVDYVNGAMPTDLRADHKLKLLTIFGNGSRSAQLQPKCVLLADANLTNRQFTFRADCHVIAGKTIAEALNNAIRLGVKISFAIDGAGSKCTTASLIDNVGAGQTATVIVEDPACLSLSNDPTRTAKKGSHVLFPRFVAFEADRPERFYTSFIENSSETGAGLTLKIPEFLEVNGDQVNPIKPVDLRTLVPNATVDNLLVTAQPLARLRVNPALVPSGSVKITGFSAGIPGTNGCDRFGADCLPQNDPNKFRLAIYGGRGSGLWFPTQDFTHSCKGHDLYSICGHYVEWGGSQGDPDITIATTELVDIASHRQYCRMD